MLITEILERNARMYGNEIALIERDPEKGIRRTMTWKEFDDQANKFANTLIEKGIQKGDKVIHLMMNCLEWLPAYFGILRTGAWAVPLNFRFSSEDILYCAKIAEAKAMIYGEQFTERIDAILDDLESIETYFFVGETTPPNAENFKAVLADGKVTPVKADLHYEDEAGLYFTSGTTGQPKPILLTHKNLESACVTENRHHLQEHEDNFLLIPPLYHTGAKMHWFGNFIVGAPAVILKGIKPQWILEAVSEEKVTIVWLLVPWAQDILITIENGDVSLDDYNLDQWRLMHIGAQPVPPALIKQWKKVFPNQDYDTDYGLSESTGPGCVHLGMGNEHKVGAIGIPGFDWETRVTDLDRKPVKQGQPGELMIKGPGVMKGKLEPLCLDAVFNGVLPNLKGGFPCPFTKDFSETFFLSNLPGQGQDSFSAPPYRLHPPRIFPCNDTFFVEFHRKSNCSAGGNGIQSIPVAQVIGRHNDLNIIIQAVGAKTRQSFIFREMPIDSGIGTRIQFNEF